MESNTYKEKTRCHTELAAAENELRAGNPEVHGLLLSIVDWNAELRLIDA